jgi:hypothetical protein
MKDLYGVHFFNQKGVDNVSMCFDMHGCTYDINLPVLMIMRLPL